MGLSMLNLSVLKFVNVAGFTKAFCIYSLLAKRAKTYALLYPFAELLLGIFYWHRSNLLGQPQSLCSWGLKV